MADTRTNEALASALDFAGDTWPEHHPRCVDIREAARRLREVEEALRDATHADGMCDAIDYKSLDVTPPDWKHKNRITTVTVAPTGCPCTCGLDALRRVVGGGR